MSKIVCDICGTTYDDAAASCPVCGWKPGKSLEVDPDDMDDLDLNLEEAAAPAAAPAAKGKAAFDFDAANARRRPAPQPPKPQQPEDEDDEDEDEEEEESGSNKFLVIILVLLILALLAVSGYIAYNKFIKPSKGSDDSRPKGTLTSQVADPTDPSVADPAITNPADVGTDPSTEPSVEAPTEETGVPCTNLSMVSGMDTLTFKGQYWRLMVSAEPKDTTDKVVYTSGDENVVTIDEYGRVTAVGEGETVIIVTCGSKRIETPAVVNFGKSEADATEESTAATATDVGTTVATPNSNVVLKLKKTDVTIGKLGVYITLELENGISANDVKWSTSDSGVASVWGGNVTATGRGTAVITAEYNGQKATCVVRVKY